MSARIKESLQRRNFLEFIVQCCKLLVHVPAIDSATAESPTCLSTPLREFYDNDHDGFC